MDIILPELPLHALLIHPAVQAFLAPFLVALLTAELMQRLRLSGLALLAGVAITIYLSSNFAFSPLTGTRKIIWLTLGSGLLALPLILLNFSLWRPVLSTLAAAAAVWTIQPLLTQLPTGTALQWGLGIALFAGWITYWLDTMHDHAIRAASAGIALALGSAAALLIANLTLPGKLDLAAGAATLAYLLIMVISGSHLSCGRLFTLPLAVLTICTTSHAVMTGKLPWYTLAALAGIPLIARLPVSDSPVWVQATLLCVASLLLSLLAAYTSWGLHHWSAF